MYIHFFEIYIYGYACLYFFGLSAVWDGHIFLRQYCANVLFATCSGNVHWLEPPCVVAFIAFAQKIARVAIAENAYNMLKMMMHAVFGYTTTNGWKQTLQRSNLENHFGVCLLRLFCCEHIFFLTNGACNGGWCAHPWFRFSVRWTLFVWGIVSTCMKYFFR